MLAGVVVVVVDGAEVVVVAVVVVVTGAAVVVVVEAAVVVVVGAAVVVVVGAAVVVVVGALVVVVVGARVVVVVEATVVVVVGATVVVAGAFVVVVVVAGATVVGGVVVVVAAGAFVVVVATFVVGASDGGGDGVVMGELMRIGVVIADVESSSVELAARVGADELVVASEPELFRVPVTVVRAVVVEDAMVADVALVVFVGACVVAAGAVEPSVGLAVGVTVASARLATTLTEFGLTFGGATTRTAGIVTGAALLVRTPVPTVGARTPATDATESADATESVLVSKTMAAALVKISRASVVVDSASPAAGGPAASAESETGCSFWRTTWISQPNSTTKSATTNARQR